MRWMLVSALSMGLVLGAGCISSSEEAAQRGASAHVDDVHATADAGSSTPALDLVAFERLVFDGTSKTEGVVVLHEGSIVYERYAAGFDASKRHLAYSVSKSVGGALLGIAVGEGLLGLEDSVCTYVPAPPGADPSYCETKIVQLLQMTSGLAWDESYENPVTSNVLPMLYGDEADMGLYVARRPRAKPAGTAWKYSTGDSMLLARALRSALGAQDMRVWTKQRLFAPAGLSSAIVESDRSGTLVLAGGVFMTPRDMAAFGQLYLDDGRAGGTQVLSPKWVAFSRSPAPPVSTPRPHGGFGLDERGGSYGASFWLNAATPTAPVGTLLYAQAPRDTFCAQGQWGQRICVIPSRRLVVVRVGNDRVGFYDVGPALGAAVAAADQAKGARR